MASATRYWMLTLVGLGAVATTLPIFGGYLVGFLLLVTLSGLGLQQLITRARGGETPEGVRYRRLVRPLAAGIAGYLGCMLVAAAASPIFSPFSLAWKPSFEEFVHLGLKTGLLALVFGWFFAWALRRGLRWPEVLPWFVPWLGLHLVYVAVQRYTGIDWSHGFDAVLPERRFAYGVYRTSGFMGHPLTLSYNLVLLALATLGLMRMNANAGQEKKTFYLWGAASLLTTVTLLLTGSRFPIAALGAAVVAGFGLWLWRYKLAALMAGSVAAVVLWLEGSIVGRSLELLSGDVPWAVKFPRIFFWKAHARMFLDQPVFGVGIAGREAAERSYYAAIGYKEKMYSAHNIYLQTLADSGLVGFAGLVALLVGFGVTVSRMTPGAGRAALLMIGTAVAVSGLMLNVLRDSEFMYCLWFFVFWIVARDCRLQKS